MVSGMGGLISAEQLVRSGLGETGVVVFSLSHRCCLCLAVVSAV